jgi:predicted membrane channel-forming protein YqfA (hemolysin III family)
MAKKKFSVNAPKRVTFWISLVLGLLGVIGSIVPIPFVSTIAPWVLALGWLLLTLGCFVKGL